MGRNSCSVVVELCLIMAMMIPSLAIDYNVGDSSGWSIGTDYDTWAKDKTFKLGDNLVFKYTSGHTVDEVKSADYTSCTTGNSITTDSSGSTTIPLTSTGDHYFICGITGHCNSGMKLSVKVVAAGTPGGLTPPAPGSSETPTSNVPDSSSVGSVGDHVVWVVVVGWASWFLLRFV